MISITLLGINLELLTDHSEVQLFASQLSVGPCNALSFYNLFKFRFFLNLESSF